MEPGERGVEVTGWRGPQYASSEKGGGALRVISEGVSLRFRELLRRFRRQDFWRTSGGRASTTGVGGGLGDGAGE